MMGGPMTRQELHAQLYSAAQAQASLGVTSFCMHVWRRNGTLIPSSPPAIATFICALMSKRSWPRAEAASLRAGRKSRWLQNERAGPEMQTAAFCEVAVCEAKSTKPVPGSQARPFFMHPENNNTPRLTASSKRAPAARAEHTPGSFSNRDIAEISIRAVAPAQGQPRARTLPPPAFFADAKTPLARKSVSPLWRRPYGGEWQKG